MIVDEKINLVKKYLRSKKESNVIELIIKDYNKSNFYMAIVFNKKLEKFKSVYVALDTLEGKNVDDYVCYQFVSLQYVNYILQTVYNSKEEYNSIEKREMQSNKINSFYLQITTNIAKEEYVFKATRYLPKNWLFMFEPIVILFEHAPNIMSELCQEILSVLTDSNYPIDYKASLNFDLFKDDYSILFTKQNIKEGNEYYANNKIEFLEKVDGKYFAIVKEHIAIIEFNNNKKILNVFCDCSCRAHGKHIYSSIKAIRENKFKNFYKLMVVRDKSEFLKDNPTARYYLCYGLENNNLKVIKGSVGELLPLKLYKEGKIKIIEDDNGKLENKINQKLKMSS